MRVVQWHGDSKDIFNFYKSLDYTYHPKTGETVLVAMEDDNKILGVVRLSKEGNILHLRGMRIRKDLQRKGIGTTMLQKASEVIGNDTCYLVGYPHLESFYRQIGFKGIKLSESPTQVQDRYNNAKKRFPDKKFNIMVRTPKSQ